ncbi:DUF444 family protein [Candidatus Woesearchaeota archaeon]|nr:DUF444 family protein [Candidatus Woesearchaeota archaeon]
MLTLDELLKMDERRKNDGFYPRIKIGRIIRPGERGKVVIFPTTIEEKFYHDNRDLSNEEDQTSGGSGEGEEGDVVGYIPEEGQGGQGRGSGSEDHGEGTDAYELGKILAERLKLPNLKDKGRKHLAQPKYDLTDRNKGSGQILDKKATLKNVIRTNIALGRLTDPATADMSELIINPRDKEYRILSREQQYEAQALVFFGRDYSGSMVGQPSKAVVSQHLWIYCWLMYQYERRVDTRFVLHDDAAKEVSTFEDYYRRAASGGTTILSLFKYINDVVNNENLARDNNIYVFYGTDGDDVGGNDYSKVLASEIEKMLGYSNRLGITIVNHRTTSFGTNLESSGLLTKYDQLIKVDSFDNTVTEERLREGVRKLVS